MVNLKVEELKSWRYKVVGLINKEKAYPVLIRTRFGIHTFGLKFPIDVIILDKDNKVVKISQNLKPNRVFIWFPFFDKVVELPKGEIKNNNIKLGEILQLKIIK